MEGDGGRGRRGNAGGIEMRVIKKGDGGEEKNNERKNE